MDGVYVVIGGPWDKEVFMAALPEGREYLTVDEVAELLQVDRRTVLNLLHRKELIGFRVGRQWRIRREEFKRFTGEHEEPDTSSTNN